MEYACRIFAEAYCGHRRIAFALSAREASSLKDSCSTVLSYVNIYVYVLASTLGDDVRGVPNLGEAYRVDT